MFSSNFSHITHNNSEYFHEFSVFMSSVPVFLETPETMVMDSRDEGRLGDDFINVTFFFKNYNIIGVYKYGN